MQVGGSDQWGNITAGIDLIRRRTGAQAHGLTVPLVTRADGAKFGKTTDGAVWLDPERTLPYELHQYFVNVDDRDVDRFLLQLTLVPVDEVAAVMADHGASPDQRLAQHRLADEVCNLVHGVEATGRARLAAQARPDTSGPAAGRIRINGERVPDGMTALPSGSAVDGRFVLLQKGKRQRHLLIID